MNTHFDISIIIPAKDEQARLPRFLFSVIDYCKKSPLRYEIIIVDDGSTDQTFLKAQDFTKDFADLKVIRLLQNRGKGYAVKQGFFASTGDVALFLDADGSTPVHEIERNLPYLSQGYDIVIGSRVVEGGSVQALAYRKWMGMIFNGFVHTFLIKDIKDTQCGFKMFRRSVIRPLWARVYLDGFGFDLEVLYLAEKMGFKIKECPVNWTHVDGSKIRLLQDSTRMLINILQIRNWHYLPINTDAQHMSGPEIANMYAQEKEHWWFKAKGEFIRAIFKQIVITPQNILDAGCGTGHNMEFLRSGADYIGCDVVYDALDFCQKNGINHLVQCNLEDMPFKCKSFDLIVSLDVIEHVEDPDRVLTQLKTILKDNGTMIISVPAFRFLWSPHDESLSHMRRYNRRDFLKLLGSAGLKVERQGYLFFATFLPVALIRILRRIFVKSLAAQSDTYHSPSPLINGLLTKIFKWEAGLVPKVRFPFGTSLYAVVRKN